MDDRDFIIARRAALLKQAQALKDLRDGILQEIRLIERQFEIGTKHIAEILPSDSIAGAVLAVNDRQGGAV